MKKYYLAMISLCLLIVENILMTVLIYGNPSRQNILNISGTIIGVLIACAIAIVLVIIKEKINGIGEQKNVNDIHICRRK